MISLKSIRAIPHSGSDWDEVERLKADCRALLAPRHPMFFRAAELEPVLHYKLRSQLGRTARHRTLWTDELVQAVTTSAFSAVSQNRDVELRLRIGILTVLPGVGVPVASAILALADPQHYAIIDFRNWRQIFDEERRTFSVQDYLRYMRRIWKLSDRLGWPPQKVDWCIWQHDLSKRGSLSV